MLLFVFAALTQSNRPPNKELDRAQVRKAHEYSVKEMKSSQGRLLILKNLVSDTRPKLIGEEDVQDVVFQPKKADFHDQHELPSGLASRPAVAHRYRFHKYVERDGAIWIKFKRLNNQYSDLSKTADGDMPKRPEKAPRS